MIWILLEREFSIIYIYIDTILDFQSEIGKLVGSTPNKNEQIYV